MTTAVRLFAQIRRRIGQDSRRWNFKQDQNSYRIARLAHFLGLVQYVAPYRLQVAVI